MSAESKPDEYLDAAGVAARIGIKRASVWSYLYRGLMPEPDMNIVGHPFWLVETIDDWRRQKGKWRKHRAPLERRAIAAPKNVAKVKIARAGARLPAQPRAARKRTRAGASVRPPVSSVSEKEAAAIAAELRAGGTPCTAADVMVLADHDGEGLEYEREVLRQRILQRLKAGGR